MPLLQKSRRPTQASSASGSASTSRRQQAEASDELPPYEAPSQPLNAAARQALAQISNNRTTRKFDEHLKKSSELLRDAVGATNDRAWEANWALQRVKKRAETGQDKPDDDRELEEYASRLSENVSVATSKLEAAIRDIIDYRVELEDEGEVLNVVRGEVAEQVRTWESRQAKGNGKRKEPRKQADPSLDDAMEENDEDGQENEDEEESESRDPGENTPVTGVNEIMHRVRQSKAEDWARMNMAQRYGEHNDYVIFKRTLHDAQHPDDGVNLPHSSAWFGPDGHPVLSKVGEEPAIGDDGDDELRIAGEVLSFKCPLSMKTMEEPYSASKKCKHAFEKKSILEFIGNKGMIQCPVVGCTQTLSVGDLSLDRILLRKLMRHRKAEANRQDDDFEMAEDEDVADETIVAGSTGKVKPEKSSGRLVEVDADEE